MKLENILGKPTQCAITGELLGAVEAVLFDNTDKKCYLQTTSGIFAFCAAKKNLLLLVEPFSPQSEHFCHLHPLTPGLGVFDTNGKCLGQLCNAAFSQKFALQSLETPQTSLKRGRLIAVDDIAVIKAPSVATRKTKSDAIKLPVVKQQPPTPPCNKKLRKSYGDFGFLVGKFVDKTVVNFQGEIMVKKDEPITTEVLRQAKISGKLIELYLHIK